jgi:drug/metabolite transporter (DMT)-like permease
MDSKNARHRALLIMVVASTAFGAMAFAAKIASKRLSGPEVALIRMAAGLIPCVIIPRYRRAALKFQRLDLLLYRGLFGGLAVMLYFLAIEHTTAGIATLLNYTAPIWSGLFSMLFIGERASGRVLLPLPIALVGIFLVVHAAPFALGRWETVGLCSALASGAAVTAMRAARRTENSWSVYASFCFFGLLVNAPLALRSWKNPAGWEWLALAATALFAMVAQLLLTFSLRWVDALTVGVISQLAVLIALALGALFLGDRITPIAAIGAALTIAGVLGVTYITSAGKREAAADEVVPEV